MRTLITILLTILVSTGSGHASERITTQDQFLQQVVNRTLSMRLFNVHLNVQQQGTITGSIRGEPTQGTWVWQNGMLCGTMQRGNRHPETGCQTVHLLSNNRVRLTADNGQGRALTLHIQQERG